MNKLTGKCKTCLGCALLEDEKGFKGREKCDYYIKDRASWLSVFAIGLLFVLLGLGIAYGLYRFSILCGG